MRRAEIRQRLAPLALPAPEFAAGVEDFGLRGVEHQRGVVIGDGAVDIVLAVMGGRAREQRLETIGLRGLCVADQRTANRDDPVVVIGRGRRKAWRGIDLQILVGLGAGRERRLRRRRQRQRDHNSSDNPARHRHQLIVATNTAYRQRQIPAEA